MGEDHGRWVDFYCVGHCSKTLMYVKIWVENKKFGFGWKEWR